MGSQTFIPRDYDVFAGLDVDKKSISVTFTDHQGLLKSMRMPYSVDHFLSTMFASTMAIRKWLLPMRPDQRATACMMGWSLNSTLA